LKTCTNCQATHDQFGELCRHCFWDKHPTDQLENAVRNLSASERHFVQMVKRGEHPPGLTMTHILEDAATIESILEHRR
jgi:hypothetical protein